MGSQTLEILRQGVWASLTGGWFYDPHQGVFCNVVHLYLWLFLLCTPFVTYLYFPATLLTWSIYCAMTSLTILGVKMGNMALHRLYDRAQTMSESNLKNPFFKITKDSEGRDDEVGIEMQVMGNDLPSRNSVEQAINEASDENSIMSMENVNSIIDLKVDVHRKNSSESIELMFYAPSMMSSTSQQDQQLATTCSNSVSKSIRATAASNNMFGTPDTNSKYLTVYPEHENEIPNTGLTSGISSNGSSRPAPRLQRKSTADFKRRHQRRRLERQNSLDAATENALVPKLARNPSENLSTVFASYCNETFLHPQQSNAHALGKSISASKVSSSTNATSKTTIMPLVSGTVNNAYHQRLPLSSATTSTTTIYAATSTTTNSPSISNPLHAQHINKSSRLQRHRSSETHDERIKQHSRGIFLPIHHEHHHVSSVAGSSGALSGIHAADELELGLGGSAGVGANSIDVGRRGHGLLSLVFGSSTDVYIEDDSFTKSDLGIEQLDKRNSSSPGPKSRSTIVLQQKQHANMHYYQHQQQFRKHHNVANIRKDSNSTMSALQLPVAATPSTSKQATNIKRRRHSNATSLYKSGAAGGMGLAPPLGSGQQPTVRRIKSAALEICCPHPSVSNLTPHPNSVEAISGQQQIKNPQSALLPPPSKCLVRNPHLNLCPSYGGSFGSSASSLNFGTNGSTTALIDPVYPIVEQADEKASVDLELSEETNNKTVQVVVQDVDNEGAEIITDNSKAVGNIDNNENPGEKMEGILTNQEHDEFKFDDDLEEIVSEARNVTQCSSCKHDQKSSTEVNESKDPENTVNHGEEAAAAPQILREHLHYTDSETDDNLDDVINEIEPNEMQGAICSHDQDLSKVDNDSDDSEDTTEHQEDEAAAAPQTLRERLHSTDSETDNNGSRSPLLSGSKNKERCFSAAADKALMLEIAAMQQQKSTLNNMLPQYLYEVRLPHCKGEGDSGCPSSDCEQVSASSKDMLLSGMEMHSQCSFPNAPKLIAGTTESIAKQIDGLVEIEQFKPIECASTSAAAAFKSLGAIPKVVKCREIDEMHSINEPTPENEATNSPQHQIHNRRSTNISGNGQSSAATAINLAPSKTTSRTSSSTSSRSFSADSFSADIHKMLWLMSGGAVDDSGRPITVGANEDGQPINAQGNVVPSSMSIAHFQFYQDALNALHSHPSNSVDGLSVSDRMYLREKLRRSSKQMSEPGNLSIGEFSHAHDLPAALLSAGASHEHSTINDQAIGAVVSSSTIAGGTRNASHTAPLTIQGLINVINDGRHNAAHARNGAAGGGSSGPTTSTAILNIEGQQIESYCDYWRPACMLSAEKPVAPKSFYKYRFKLLGFEREVKISMDRLELLALFDRDLHWMHIVLSLILAAIVSFLGATILQLGYYKDLFVFIFCAVIAGSQYSLVKSVQPDAASPIHGFNKTVAYSRAIYFSIIGGLLLLLQDLKSNYEQEPGPKLMLFSICYLPLELTTMLLHIMYVLLLCFPLIFSLGLFPQINTFLMYFLEQVDMHVFGGNAADSLLGSFLCVIRSLLGVLILYGPLYAALAERKGTQYIVFSIFCAMLIPLGYHLSRSASDFSHMWALIKSGIVSTYRDDDDDEVSAATSTVECQSQKLTTSTPKRAKNTPGSRGGEQIEMSSMEKLPTIEQEELVIADGKSCKSKHSSLASSSQTLGKTISSSKKAVTTSNSFTSVDEENCVAGLSADNERSADNDGDEDEVKVDANKQTSATIKNLQTEDDKVSTSSTTNPGDISTLTAGAAATTNAVENDSESPDPLPKKLQNTVNTRLKNDFVVTTLLAVIVFCLHCSTVFSVLQPDLNIVLYAIAGALGLLLHYIIPQMRKHMPWLCFSRPLLRQKEFGQFEVADAAKVMWFERVYIYLSLLERNVLFPLLVISALTADAAVIGEKFGIAWGTLIVVICALKFIRNAYSDPTNQYLIIMFTVLFFRADFMVASETFLIDYFFVSLAFRKCCDFLLKLQFIVTYIAPWQITWGSAFHAFAQPFSVPHSAMLFLQAGVSALLSTPLNPFLGSAIFLTSYVRPIKFWERDYNTRRIDHSNTRLSSQLERDLGADDNNLNSIFYEHLTRSLQHSLCGDLMMGRWGNVNQGDCFVLASDYLNCLVHIIELGNGLCTFQMRGLEFRGTYCQQREVEAITEDVEDNDGCCCCDPGHLPRMLSANAMFSTRWLAWQVVAAQYVLEGYSISDNLASATLQVFEYRKVLITYYIKSIIYYVIKNPKLDKWLASGPIQDALQHTLSRQFVDLDPIFNYNLDEDFDFRALGITRSSFCFVYLGWIQYCCDNRKEQQSQPNMTSSETPVGDAVSQSTQSNTTTGQAQSQSQTQLRPRPQKSATISGTGTATAANTSSTKHSSEQTMATSQSFANISRQTSESAPGLAGVGMTHGNASISTQIPLHGSLDNSSATVGGYTRVSSRAPQKPPKTYERYYKNESSTTESAATQPKNTCPRTQPTVAKNSPIVSLCLALGLLARRSLATASHSSLTGVEFFLHGLHALFKGDFRITSPRDEWVFADMELLHAVVAPAVKMALKLQQDHISNPDEFHDPVALFAAIAAYTTDLVISHEADPVWRSAVLKGAPNLLALRHVMEDGSDEYRIIRLTKRFLSFRVIKLNRECVRGLWAGQQQELIYLRNRNPERGSIQNAKQALRNIINSSCDQPIGYPIYVSPLTTSYADTNEQLCQVIGGAITPETIRSNIIDWWQRLCERCRQGCSSGSAMDQSANLGGFLVGSNCGGNISGESVENTPVYISAPLYNTLTVGNLFGLRSGNIAGISGSLSGQYGSQSLVGVPTTRNGLALMNKPTSTTLLAGLLNRERDAERDRDVRDPRIQRKGQTHSGGRNDRERRATLPITSSGLGVVSGMSTPHIEATTEPSQLLEEDDIHASACISINKNLSSELDCSPRFTKISCSSGNLGIGTIITTPGEYPRKSKGPICLSAAAVSVVEASENLENKRKTVIELFKKVIIVDGTEIYDCLDLGRRIDVVWPSEKMRANGGRLSWKDWSPRVGMVGYVVHYWLPNHADQRFRSHVNRTLYLIEIGNHYVPVGEFGVREYNQIIDGRENLASSSNRSSVQREYEEHMTRDRERKELTPILGSSLESPTPMSTSSFSDTFAQTTRGDVFGIGAIAKIAALSSSSSSEDEELSNLERRMNMHRRDIINMMKLMSEKKKDADSEKFEAQHISNASLCLDAESIEKDSLKTSENESKPLALPIYKRSQKDQEEATAVDVFEQEYEKEEVPTGSGVKNSNNSPMKEHTKPDLSNV